MQIKIGGFGQFFNLQCVSEILTCLNWFYFLNLRLSHPSCLKKIIFPSKEVKLDQKNNILAFIVPRVSLSIWPTLSNSLSDIY